MQNLNVRRGAFVQQKCCQLFEIGVYTSLKMTMIYVHNRPCFKLFLQSSFQSSVSSVQSTCVMLNLGGMISTTPDVVQLRGVASNVTYCPKDC